MVKLNTSCWELSECNCNFWQKNYKCFHIVMCAYREPSCSFKFDAILLLLPCERTKKKGRKKNLTPALTRQSIDNEATQIGINYSDEEMNDTQVVSKKAKLSENTEKDKATPRICQICGSNLKKALHFYCPNECLKKQKKQNKK